MILTGGFSRLYNVGGGKNTEGQRSVYKYGGKKGDFIEILPKLIEERSEHGCGYYINEKNEVVFY